VLLIRWQNRASRQAENPLSLLSKFAGPALRDEKPGILDSVELSVTNNQSKPEVQLKHLKVIQYVSRALGPIDPIQNEQRASSDAALELDNRQRANIDSLSLAFRDQMERLAKTAEELQTDNIEHRRQIETELDGRRADQDAQHQARLDETDVLRQQLEQSKKSLDDRNNTHVRRDLRQGLQCIVAERFSDFGLSKSTKRQSYWVHIVVWLLLLGLGVSFAFFTTSFIQALTAGKLETVMVMVLSAKTALNALALGAITWFYLRWLSRRFDRMSEAELDLRQFQLDVDRASWAVEAAFEWQLQRDQACGNCHTSKTSDGKPVSGKELSGGVSFTTPAFNATAANITPDRETGIGTWSDDDIKRALTEGVRPSHAYLPSVPLAAVMPAVRRQQP
jgi:hypothetical protein